MKKIIDKTFVKFVGVGIINTIFGTTICYLIAYGVAKPVIRLILRNASKSLQENCAMLCGMGLFVILNYMGQRFGVFRKEII